MKNNVSTIVLLLISILNLFTLLNIGYGATVSPDLPQWKVGKWWKVSMEISGNVTLVGTSTFTIVSDDVDITQNGQTFSCYQIDVSGGGTLGGEIDGNEVEGIWTAIEQQYYAKSDQSWVAVNSTYEETFSVNHGGSGIITISWVQDGTITSTATFETTYDPPFEANKGFPLTVGKRWSAATTETTKTQTTVNGITESATESEAYTKSYVVLRKESMSLSSGEVETYVTKRTDPDGAYAEIYYSPEVGFDVKQIEYDSTGISQLTLELLDYEYEAPLDVPQLFTNEIFQILIVLTILAVTVLVVVYFVKRKKTDGQSQTNDFSSLTDASSRILTFGA
jgi:hypothetical protein